MVFSCFSRPLWRFHRLIGYRLAARGESDGRAATVAGATSGAVARPVYSGCCSELFGRKCGG
jgi:hypothetical protein